MADTLFDDCPHPVPAFAYLRYKENWLWHFMDTANGVYGSSHFSYEPLFNRARMSCMVVVDGKVHTYANEIPFPAEFAYTREIGDGRLRVLFVEPQRRFELHLDSDVMELAVHLERRGPMFDFEAYEKANPDKPQVFALMNLNTRMPHTHHQQVLDMHGTLRLKGGRTMTLNGVGNRDHSQGVRCDNLTHAHTWSWLLFPLSNFAATTLTALNAPTLEAAGGYMNDADGLRALTEIAVEQHGRLADGMPETVRFRFGDPAGRRVTIVASIAQRLGCVPLSGEKPVPGQVEYLTIDNFCRCRIEETGEEGLALIEIGYHPAYAK